MVRESCIFLALTHKCIILGCHLGFCIVCLDIVLHGFLSLWGFVPLGFCPPGLLSHLDIVPLGFCPPGILSPWDFVLLGFCPLGYCPMGFCPVGFCPRTARATPICWRVRVSLAVLVSEPLLFTGGSGCL